jgi:Flp pilus assembly protein TadG
MGSRRGQAGTSVPETAIVIVVMLTAILTAVQSAVWYHERAAVTAAARLAADAARVQGGTEQAGEDIARSFLARGAGLRNVQVAVHRNGATVAVTVSGSVLQMVPGLPLTVSAHVEVPTEDAALAPGAVVP